MSRVKISEYDAKKIIYPALHLTLHALPATSETTANEVGAQFPNENLVVKVDEGVKKRGKQGLVKVNLTPREVVGQIKIWERDGWSRFLVEPVVEHAESAERYVSLTLARGGWQVLWSEHGGVNVEQTWSSVKSNVPDNLRSTIYDLLIPALVKHHVVFLEMNPVVVRDGKMIPLDAAAEVDSAALTLSEVADVGIKPLEDKGKTVAERGVAALDESTPASLKFRSVNPDGRIWMLLSGGGASLVLADEVADQGMGKELANYGEYSGAPTDDDVYAYTKLVLQELLRSTTHKPRSIIVAGGVANFTDVASTFRGLIRALDEKKSELKKAKVKVYVRRGGPNEVKGLALMRDFLTRSQLLGSVHGHETPLTKVVKEVKDYIK